MATLADARQSSEHDYYFEFHGEPLREVLDKIIRETEIDLVYDPQLVEGMHIYKRVRSESANDLLRILFEDLPLDYITLSTGTFVLIESVEQGPFFGTFTGKVVDAESGEPLPGATIMLADASGGVSANRSGNFSINRMMHGTHRIIFSYVGYEPVYKTIEIRPDRETMEKVEMHQKPVNVSPVIVEAHRQRLPNGINSSEFNPGSNLEPAGAMQDPIRTLSLAPGIQYGLPMSDLRLDGGQSSEHRILLDGVPIYNPHSFGQMFSSFSPYAIGGINLYNAGYGVEAGSQIAGLVDITHDMPAGESNSAILQGDPLSLNIRGDLTFDYGDESSLNLMTSVRSNYWDFYQNPTMRQTLENWDILDPFISNILLESDVDASYYSPVFHESDIGFFDFHMAGSYKIDDFNSLSGSLYIAENSIETRLLNQQSGDRFEVPFIYASDSYDWENLMAQVTWDQWITPRLDLSVQASYSRNSFTHKNRIGTSQSPVFLPAGEVALNDTASEFYRSERLLPTQIDGNNIDHFILKSDASFSITPNYSLRGGLQFDRVQSGVDISNLTYLPADVNQSSTLISSYLKNRHTFSRYWNIEWGSRFTYTSLNDHVYAEPRISVQFDRPDSGIGNWSARISGGLYRQFINEYRITNSGPTSLVPNFSIWSHADNTSIPKAWHLSGSFIVEPSGQTTITTSGYYKWQPVTNITSYNRLSDARPQTQIGRDENEISAFAETTEMTVAGGGIRIEQKLADAKLNIIAGYDYTFSRLNLESQFGQTLPAPWNDPHRVQFRTLWHLFSDVTVSAKWQGIWGRTWAFRDSYYNFLRFRDTEISLPVDFNSPQNDRLSPFHQADLSFIYRPTLGNTDFDIRLELINILNHTNTLDKHLEPLLSGSDLQGYQVRSRTLPGFYPSFSISATF